VIPSEAYLSGTIRVFSTETLDLIKSKIASITQATAMAHSCQASVEITDQYPPVINHPEGVAFVTHVAN
jgi:hippurate hydrolase